MQASDDLDPTLDARLSSRLPEWQDPTTFHPTFGDDCIDPGSDDALCAASQCGRCIRSDLNCGGQACACRLGFGRLDADFIPPRTWFIRNLLQGRNLGMIVERDELLFDDHFYRPVWRLTGDVFRDHQNFYSWGGLGLLGLGVGLHAVLANTTLDQRFRDSFQDKAVGSLNSFKFAKYFGETWIMVPTLFAFWGLDALLERHGCVDDAFWHCQMADWSRQSLGALLVGAPAVGVLQISIGASRPGESSAGSRWKPFDDHNSVSGHAFVGAVPFLVAARRTDNLLLKSAFFAGSCLTGYSRVYDDAHYLSQVLLGWSIAYLAVEATYLTERSPMQFRVVPLNLGGLVGIGFEFRR